MMENRAYEDEANRSSSAHLHHHQQQQQHHQHHRPYHPHQSVHPPAPMQPQQYNLHMRNHPEPYHPYIPENFAHHPYHNQQQPQQQQQHFGPHRFDTQVTSECHVYEDIVAPYGLDPGGGSGGGFHRNLTLPLRRTSQSCESIEGNPQSSSVRVTNRERTRGSVIDRLTREDRNRDSGSRAASDESSSVERPARRRRKKDCKHCKASGDQQQQQQVASSPQYEERSAEIRAIFGLPDVSVCRLAAANGCLGTNVVYAIGCNGTDCNNSLVSGGGESTATTTTTTTTGTSASARFAPAPDDDTTAKVLGSAVGPPNNNSGAGGRAGMKVNSIYAQDHWTSHAAKDPRIFLGDPKEQANSPFQRAYSAVSANSPSSENRANLRRSVRDEPAPHPARLRKHRHGWTLHFGRPLNGTACTKSLILVLIVVLALLGIGGIALYIVFEPEKLHVIGQYLRRNGTGPGQEHLEDQQQQQQQNQQQFALPAGFSTSTSLPPSSTFLDALNDTLNVAAVSTSSSSLSINSNNVPGSEDANDVNVVKSAVVPTWSSPSTPTTTSRTTVMPTIVPVTSTTTRSLSSSPKTTTTTTRDFLEAHSRPNRPCTECRDDEVCVARNADEMPHCRSPTNARDTSGCGGLCDDRTHKCHSLGGGAFRCTELEHNCLDDEWTCLNIFCIPLVKRCDGQMNCYDHSDEYNCECNLETHFHCGNQTSCLPLSKKCDGHVDCFDATDEANCTTSHELGRLCKSKDDYACRDSQQCIKRSRFCDGYRDCRDGSDEPHGCHGRCNKHEFTCHNGRCIDKADKCNGTDDCGDGSDEQHCRERL